MDVEGEGHKKNDKAKVNKQKYKMRKTWKVYPKKNFCLLRFAF
jgi:hypothetical protein